MRIGVFIGDASGLRTSVDDLLSAARDAEARGFATGWVPHIPWSLDALTALAVAAGVTDRIELGTAVVPTYARHPLNMAQDALSVQAVSGGRLALGIGPSHPVVVENMYGLSYDRPAAHTREYVEVLQKAFAGTGFVSHDGEFFRSQAMLEVPGATTPPALLVAALAPRMLQLAGELTDGTITYWADERAIGEHVAPRLTAAASAAGRPAPRVVLGLPIGICDDVDAGRATAEKLFSTYESIPTYQRILGRGASGRPVDVAIVGDEADATARLQAYADAGATELCAAVIALGPDKAAGRARTLDFLQSLV